MSEISSNYTAPLSAPARRSAWVGASNVFRSHMVDRWEFLGLPWLVLGSAFVINLLIFALLTASGVDNTGDGNVTGGIMSIFIYGLVAGVVAVSQGYRYCLAMSVTRREFYVGTLGMGIFMSAFFAVGLVLLGLVESLTDGWGLDLSFFNLPWLTAGGIASTLVVWFSIALFLFSIGATFAINYARWGLTGSWMTGLLLALLVVGFFALLVYVPGMAPVVWQWVSSQSALQLALWLLIPSALMAGLGWLFIRRAPVR